MMFTGIVRTVGRIDERVEHAAGDVSFAVATAAIDPAGIAVGDSICVSGACLTAVEVTPAGFRTDISAESLARTTLRGFAAGRRVNLETALKPDTPLGGHLVSGHVDGVAEVLARRGDARSVRFEIRAPEVLARYNDGSGSRSSRPLRQPLPWLVRHRSGAGVPARADGPRPVRETPANAIRRVSDLRACSCRSP